MLDIVVCVKPVPDPRHWGIITLDPVRKTLNREGVPLVINPSDKNALEGALRIREKQGGRVTVISMAPAFSSDVLREALATGADAAVLLSDRLFAGADTLATAYVLAEGIKKLGRYDLILCGNQSLDGSTGQVGPEIAEFLEIPHLTNVRAMDIDNNREVQAECERERGFVTIGASLPLLMAVTGKINVPRHIPLAGVLKAAEAEIKVWNSDDLDVDRSRVGLEGSPTRVTNIFMPEFKRRREVISGGTEATARLLLQKLHELGALK